VELEGHFWCYRPYITMKKNNRWPFEADSDFQFYHTAPYYLHSISRWGCDGLNIFFQPVQK
jgi:hypothetical protein